MHITWTVTAIDVVNRVVTVLYDNGAQQLSRPVIVPDANTLQETLQAALQAIQTNFPLEWKREMLPALNVQQYVGRTGAFDI
jgi:hypothetical protein